MIEFLLKVLGRARPELDEPTRSLSSLAPARPALEPVRRLSHGLESFLGAVPRKRILEILDLGGANGGNAAFWSEIRGRVHSIDLVALYDQRRRDRPGAAFDPAAARDFVDEALNFSRKQFDAILVWDALEFLDSDSLHLAVQRLGLALRPGGVALCIFHTQSRGAVVPVHRFEIEGRDRLVLHPRETRRLPNTFNNRSLERLFAEFESVKFFLARDNLREIVVLR